MRKPCLILITLDNKNKLLSAIQINNTVDLIKYPDLKFALKIVIDYFYIVNFLSNKDRCCRNTQTSKEVSINSTKTKKKHRNLLIETLST